MALMNNILAFGMPGGQEMIVILVIILLLFGAKRLPELSPDFPVSGFMAYL